MNTEMHPLGAGLGRGRLSRLRHFTNCEKTVKLRLLRSDMVTSTATNISLKKGFLLQRNATEDSFMK